MNRLLALLELENDPTPRRLTQLYRQLTKKAHPDLASGSHEAFLRLRREYEEAVRALRAAPRRAPRSGAQAGTRGGREAVLELLYRYAVRFYGKDSDGILARLIEAARGYDSALCTLLEAYRESFPGQFHAWVAEGTTYYAHSLFIACAKQLAYLHSFGIPRHRVLLADYLAQLRGARARRLPAGKAAVLDRLADWLERESQGPSVRTV